MNPVHCKTLRQVGFPNIRFLDMARTAGLHNSEEKVICLKSARLPGLQHSEAPIRFLKMVRPPRLQHSGEKPGILKRLSQQGSNTARKKLGVPRPRNTQMNNSSIRWPRPGTSIVFSDNICHKQSFYVMFAYQDLSWRLLGTHGQKYQYDRRIFCRYLVHGWEDTSSILGSR